LRGAADGEPTPLSLARPGTPPGDDSELVAGVAAPWRAPGERPGAVVVVGEGRLTRPGPDEDEAELRRVLGDVGIPVHTVGVTEDSPPRSEERRVGKECRFQ